MTLRDQLRRAQRRGQTPATGEVVRDLRDHSSETIHRMREKRQARREQEQLAGPDDGREMFKLAEEAGRLMAPVDTDLNPGNPEAVGLMAESDGMMMVDQLASGDSAEGDMADLMVAGDTEGGLTGFLSGGDG